tara:strand:+ start:126 stop:1163 length:1038 start_codon:yes stop_codon:yes gene_type:complete
MAQKRPAFNGQGTIDLEIFEQLEPREQLDAQFLHFDFLDLNNVDIDDDDYFNLAIRSETPDEFRKRVDDISISYKEKGFLTSYWPPCFGTDDRPRDGRGRIKAAKENGERWVPIAIYDYQDDSTLNYITNGLLANDHDPAVRPQREDFVRAGVTLISQGDLVNSDVAINDWLYSKAKVERFFKGTHNYTKIINEIKERAAKGGEPLVDVRSSDDWKSWIETNLKWKDRKDYILSCVGNVSYINRTWCENILPAIKKNQHPVNIILYTNSQVPKTARESMKKFVEAVHSHYETSYKMVNNSLVGSNVTVPSIENRPYKFVGALPQIYGKHVGPNIISNKLISLSQY